jgi:heavy metal efflux system protein
MKLLMQFILQNRFLMILIGIIILGSGIYSYKNLPLDALPEITPPVVRVYTISKGLSPEEVEKLVTYPVEVSMTGLPKVAEIRSNSSFGLSIVNIFFEDETDIYFARQLVNERLQDAVQQIPEGYGTPEMGPISTVLGLVMFYYLEDSSGNYTLEELRTMQDWMIKPILRTIPGVTEVISIGGFEKQYQVIVNPESLLRYKITLNEIIDKIQTNNSNVGAQYIIKNAEEFTVSSLGLVRSIEDLSKIVVKTIEGTPIFLNDLSEIRIGGDTRRGLQTRNGEKEIVAGQVVKLYGSNSSIIIEKVEKKLEEINKILPSDVSIVPYYEQKTLVNASLSTVTNALIQGIILVILVLILFLSDIRSSLIVAFSIPFSLLFAIVGMSYFGISANLMSLSGLAIAIGLLVDDAIVIIENISRMLNDKSHSGNKMKIIIQSCLEIIQPVVFSTVIIILVFIPLLTIQGVEGKTFQPLAYTVILALISSLFFALFIAPAMALIIPHKNIDTHLKSGGFQQLLNSKYKKITTYFIENQWVAISITGVLMLVGVIIFPKLGSEFTPEMDEGTTIVTVQTAPSVSLEESKRMALLVEKRLMNIPEIEEVITVMGTGEVGGEFMPINMGDIYINYKPKDEWKLDLNRFEMEDKIREKLLSVPGVIISLTQPIKMLTDELIEGVRGDLAIKLFGDDLNILKREGDKFADVLRSISGSNDVQTEQIVGSPQLVIKINRQAIARYGINVSDVQDVIQTAIGGSIAGQVFEGIQRYDIFVRYPEKYRGSKEEIENILIISPTGAMLPLSELTDIYEIVGPRQISRKNNQRFITIQCNVSNRDIGSFVEEARQVIERKIDLPSGYYSEWGGQYKLQQEANKKLIVIIPILLLIIFSLLFLNFHSFKNSLLILLNIPLALVGGIVALWITNQHLSVPSSIGFIALFGISLENGMVLISYMNQLVKEGTALVEASIQGALLRLRPVLMTALTTSLGLLPLLFATGTGSEIQRPLATVVIGGLFTSTILTLLVIPALYQWFSDEN